jgi:hypothetical protein
MFNLSRSQWSLIFLIVAVTAGSIAYRLIVSHRMVQTSLLFIGMPAVIAIFLAMTPKARTAKGAIVKGITLALLISGPVLGEGFICVLMASPIFYLVGLLIGAFVDWGRDKRNVTISCLVAILIPLSMEGTSPRLSFRRDETVTASQVVSASMEQVARALARSPRVDLPIPLFGRIGFPRPTEANGTGLEAGATRTIHFAGGEGHAGDLTLRASESRPGYVRFEKVKDRSHIALWLGWQSSETQWTALDAGHTRVTWTLHFERRLDPAWYFRPWERYAVRLSAEYLIQANAVPAAAERSE